MHSERVGQSRKADKERKRKPHEALVSPPMDVVSIALGGGTSGKMVHTNYKSPSGGVARIKKAVHVRRTPV